MDFLFDALRDSAILFPFLFAAYVLIEFLETFMQKKLKNNAFKSRFAPVIGAGVGLLPQCGFSVVATDLFSHKKITMGTLLAVFIATSDEAIPLLAVSPQKAIYLLPLLGIKFVYAIIIGFLCDAVASLLSKRANAKISKNKTSLKTDSSSDETENHHEPDTEIYAEISSAQNTTTEATFNNEENEHHENEDHHAHIGCCGHAIEEEKNEPWQKRYLLHPLVHSLKIFAFILVVNIIFNTLIFAIGEDNLTKFLTSSAPFAPLFAVIIGLIPNCASSIIVTQLFIKGGLTFGACLAGLCANAGIGLIVLIKQNKSAKQNAAIFLTLLLSSLVVGYLTQVIMQLIF